MRILIFIKKCHILEKGLRKIYHIYIVFKIFLHDWNFPINYMY